METTTPPLGMLPVTQLAFLVRDIDAAKKTWAAILGVAEPSFRLTTPGDERGLTYKGKPSRAQAKLAFFNLGQVQIELIEPVAGTGPSVWHDVLEARGEGMHHIAFKIEGMQAYADLLATHGVPLVLRGDGGTGQVAYFDANPQLGLMLELMEAVRTPVETPILP